MPEEWSQERRSVLRYLFEDRASSDPDGLCLVMPDFSEWTWRHALDAAYSAANLLRSEGVSQNDRVVIMAETREDFVRAWWGVLFLGAVIVPINPAYRGNLLRHVCVDSQADFLISGEEHRMRVEEGRFEAAMVRCLEASLWVNRRSEARPRYRSLGYSRSSVHVRYDGAIKRCTDHESNDLFVVALRMGCAVSGGRRLSSWTFQGFISGGSNPP